MLIEQGVINEHDKIAYEMWYNNFSHKICFNRIHLRNREGEKEITLKYLENFYKFH